MLYQHLSQRYIRLIADTLRYERSTVIERGASIDLTSPHGRDVGLSTEDATWRRSRTTIRETIGQGARPKLSAACLGASSEKCTDRRDKHSIDSQGQS